MHWIIRKIENWEKIILTRNALGKEDEIWAALVDEIGGLEGVWGTLKYESLKGLTDIDETIGDEKVIGDEDVIVGIMIWQQMVEDSRRRDGCNS